jgi:hypothetical protein
MQSKHLVEIDMQKAIKNEKNDKSQPEILIEDVSQFRPADDGIINV